MQTLTRTISSGDPEGTYAITVGSTGVSLATVDATYRWDAPIPSGSPPGAGASKQAVG